MEILTVRGLVIDRVVKISHGWGETGYNVEAYLSEVSDMVGSLDTYPTGEPLNDLQWKVPVGNCPNIFLNQPREDQALEDLRNSYRALRKHNYFLRKYANLLSRVDETFSQTSRTKVGEIMLSLMPDLDTLEALSTPYFRTVIEFFPHARFCITERGYVGALPPTAQVGDVVCILFGALVPFLIRPSEAKNGCYRLVGECYIHGIMNGEALKFGGVKEQDISIH